MTASSCPTSDAPSFSVVIPLYNEASVLPELWSRLSAQLEPLEEFWEVVFVDDGSTDGSSIQLQDLAASDRRVKRIRLSRNFGHQAALSAGIDAASGKAVVLMDADLQDRPEAIPTFIAEWQKGHEVVYAQRIKRKETGLRRLGFYCFYRVIDRLSGIPQPMDAGIFSLVDRRVVDQIRGMPEHNRYFPGLRAYAGFSQVGVPVERDDRRQGMPRVRFKGLVKLAFDALFSFSYVPLRLISLAGAVVASGAFLYILVIAYKKYIIHEAILGWSSMLGAILLLGGLQIVMLGILGEYIGRIYEETKRRPMYIIAETENLSSPSRS